MIDKFNLSFSQCSFLFYDKIVLKFLFKELIKIIFNKDSSYVVTVKYILRKTCQAININMAIIPEKFNFVQF